jgi:hypothetical protein
MGLARGSSLQSLACRYSQNPVWMHHHHQGRGQSYCFLQVHLPGCFCSGPHTWSPLGKAHGQELATCRVWKTYSPKSKGPHHTRAPTSLPGWATPRAFPSCCGMSRVTSAQVSPKNYTFGRALLASGVYKPASFTSCASQHRISAPACSSVSAALPVST